MALGAWWQGDPLPDLPYNDRLAVSDSDDDAALAVLNHISMAEVRSRRATGHKLYVIAFDGK